MDNVKTYSNSLMAELSEWQKREQQFRQLFGEQALKNRDFLKMKLSEFNRMIGVFRNDTGSQDDRALRMMLTFQRKSLEKTLYPGLVSRTLIRGWRNLKDLVKAGWSEFKEALKRDRAVQVPESYHMQTIPTRQDQSGGRTHDQQRKHDQSQRRGFNYGQINKDQKNNRNIHV